MGGQGTIHCQTTNMVVPVVRAEELPNPSTLWLSHDGRENSRGYVAMRGQVVSGWVWVWGCSGCGKLQSGWWFHLMRRDKNPLSLYLVHLRWVLQGSLSQHGCLSERMFTSKIYMFLHTVQLLAALLNLMSIWKHPYIFINILTDPFASPRVYISTRM